MTAGSGPVVAEPAQRLLARLIDLLVVGVPLALVAQEALPRRSAEVAESVGLAALVLVYDTVLHARWGRTLGKRIAGVRVITVAGEGVPPGRAVLRAAVFALPMAARPVPVLGLVAGLCWVAGVALILRGDQERRALHDRLAGTRVVTELRDPSRFRDFSRICRISPAIDFSAAWHPRVPEWCDPPHARASGPFAFGGGFGDPLQRRLRTGRTFPPRPPAYRSPTPLLSVRRQSRVGAVVTHSQARTSDPCRALPGKSCCWIGCPRQDPSTCADATARSPQD